MKINKNKRVVLVSVILAVCVVVGVLGSCKSSGYNEEILTGIRDDSSTSMFDYSTLSEMSKDWQLESGGANSSVFSVGSNGVNINTTNSGFAQISQRVLLKTFSYYKVEYDFDISQMTTYDDDIDYYPGLFIGFLEDPNFNVVGDKIAQETFVQQGGKRVFYFHTSGTSEYNLSINVGTSKFKTQSIATIKNVSLVRIDSKAALAVKEDGLDIFELRPTVYGQHKQSNVWYIVLGVFGILLLSYVAYVLNARYLSYPDSHVSVSGEKKKFFYKFKESKYLGILSIIGITLLLRIILLMIETIISNQSRIVETYFGYSLELLSAQGTWLSKYGMPYFYQYNESSPFLPIPLYLSTLAGLIGQGFQKIPDISPEAVMLSVITTNKIFAALADLGSVILIYSLVKKHQNAVTAVIIASLYSVLPIVFTMSTAWGSVHSIATLLVVSTFYCILNKDIIGMSISFLLACLTTTFSLFLAPIVLFYVINRIIDSIKNKKYSELITPIVCILSGFILFYLLTLPFNINEIGKGQPFIAFTKFIEQIKGQDVYTANAFNFQALLQNNFVEITVQSKVVDIIFVFFILLVFAAVYFKTNNRLNLTLLGAGILLVLWTFSNNMSYEYLILALPLLLIVAALTKDIRLYVAFALYSAFAFINNAYVFMVAGYSIEGVTKISYDGNSILYVFGAISLLLAIYLIIVGYDYLVNKKVLSIKPMNEKYSVYLTRSLTRFYSVISQGAVITFSWIKEFFSIIAEDVKEVSSRNKTRREERKEFKKNSGIESDDNDVDEIDDVDIVE